MHSSHLLELSVRGLLEVYRSREATPTDVVEAVFDRFDDIDPVLNVSLRLRREEALADATVSSARWRSGKAGALDGIPFGVKDNIDVEGSVTTVGVRGLPLREVKDSHAVAELRSHGAIPVAKLQLGAFAFGDPHNRDFGDTLNPWGSRRFTGGSSTGPAAAVAAGAVPFALGTDSGGSVRIPASHCGVSAFKPSRERISREGVYPSTASLDHVGILAHSASDIRLAFAAMTTDSVGPRGDAAAEGRARIGVLGGAFLELCTLSALRSFNQAVVELESCGFAVSDITLPALADAELVTVGIAAAEMARSMADIPGSVTLGDALAGFLEFGRTIDDAALSELLSRQEQIRFAVTDQMRDVDFMVSPTMVGVAPDIDTLLSETSAGPKPWMEIAARNTMQFNLLGLPAISVPALPADDGLPFGLQIVGHLQADDGVLAVAERYQATTKHHELRPALVAGRR